MVENLMPTRLFRDKKGVLSSAKELPENNNPTAKTPKTKQLLWLLGNYFA